MESPDSWGPLEKSVAMALGHVSMGCSTGPDSDPSLATKASWIADHLARHGAIKMKDRASAATVIEISLKTRFANPMPMISEPLEIANALRAAGVVAYP